MSTISVDCSECGEEIEVEISWEPGERGWGADADGNRGIDIPGRYVPEEPIPQCSNKCELSPKQREDLRIAAEELAYDYDDGWDDGDCDRYDDI